jgi:rare lipoprotein A
MNRKTLCLGMCLGPLVASLLGAAAQAADTQTGVSSVYWEPQKLAGGGHFRPMGMTVAHRSLPLGATVHVTNLSSGRSATFLVNDRGPYVRGRILDLSKGAARSIAAGGLTRVRIDVVSYGPRQPLTTKFQALALRKLEAVSDLQRRYRERIATEELRTARDEHGDQIER